MKEFQEGRGVGMQQDQVDVLVGYSFSSASQANLVAAAAAPCFGFNLCC